MTASLVRVMEETLTYVWWKHRIQNPPQEHLVFGVVEEMRRAVLVEVFKVAQEWEPFLRKNFRRMGHDQLSFAKYTLFACVMQFKAFKNQYEQFISCVALAAYFALFFHARSKPYGVCVVTKLLKGFLYRAMRDMKVDKEFWTQLSHHIIRKRYLDQQLLVDGLLREGRKWDDILMTIATEETIQDLKDKSELKPRLSSDRLDEFCRGYEEVLAPLRRTVYVPEPRENPIKMSMAQKRDVGHCLKQDLTKVSQKLLGIDRLLKKAKEDVEHKYNFMKGLLEAPLMEEVPAQVILDSMINIGESMS